MSLPASKITALATFNTDENTFRVLQETLYPGSTDSEVEMILGYCKARRIDPILKPVHLVSMSIKTDKKGADGKWVYERKNVIMPGIGLYRIDASRSGQYAGVSEPEFGEEVSEMFGDKVKTKVTYPKWCKITVKKLLENGQIVEFTAKEYWKENYASKSNFDNTPNAMWEKRAYGQLAKCAEAQALRKGFPDIVGNEYTKEEMEGKGHIEEINVTQKTSHVINAEVIEDHDIEKDLMDISWAEDVESLQDIYKAAYKYWAIKKNKENIAKLMEAKDKKKEFLEATVNPETGEIAE